MAVSEKISLAAVASSFDENGYPLFMEERTAYSIGIEETIILSLRSNEPRLYEGIPVLLLKNKINYKTLRTLIDEHNYWNEFGYFGEFASRHIENRSLKELITHCYENLKPSSTLYPYDTEFSIKYQEAEAKKWNLLGAPGYKELEHQFKVYTK